MPLVRITFARDRDPAETRAVMDGVYDALRATFDVPEDDRFIVVDRPAPGGVSYGAHYLGMTRGDALVIVQITCNEGRDVEKKRALYAAIAENLGRDPGVPPDDVFVSIVEVRRENWSFGRGLAQYA